MNREELISLLCEKEKWDIWRKIQLIEQKIENSNKLYNYFDDISNLLASEKSFIRMRSFRIMCKLSKWDKNNKTNDIIDLLMSVLDDDKPTIVRMCLQTVNELFLYKPELTNKIKEKLMNIDLSKYKDSMRPLIEKDINNILEKYI